MLDKLCQILKGVAVIGWLCFSQADAATCTATTSATLQTCLNNALCGDTVSITAGTYVSDKFTITNKDCPTGNPITVQPQGYSGTLGSGDAVYIYAAVIPSPFWAQCSGASGSCTCGGVVSSTPPGVACTNIWWVDGSGIYTKALGAIRPDRTPTYRTQALNLITTQYSSFSNGDFIDQNGARLFVNFGTSTPTSARETGAYVLTDSNGNPFSITNSGGIVIQGLHIRNSRRTGISATGSSVATELIRCMIGLAACNSPLNNSPECPGNTACSKCTMTRTTPRAGAIKVLNNEIAYANDRRGNGSDRGVEVFGSSINSEIAYNDIFCTASEGIHVAAAGVQASPIVTAASVHDNYIHDLGYATACKSIMGDSQNGTPSGIIIGDSTDCGTGGVGAGDFSSTQIYGNLFARINSNAANRCSKGIILENNANNMSIHDNYFVDVEGEVIKLSASYGAGAFNNSTLVSNNSTNNNTFFNNIMDHCGQCVGQSGNGASFELLSAQQSQTASNNLFINNTIGNSLSGIVSGLKSNCAGAGCASNIFRNNIFDHNGDQSNAVVDWAPTDSSNKFDHNLVHSTDADTIVKWAGTSYTANALVAANTSSVSANLASDPAFLNVAQHMFYPVGGSNLTSDNIESNATFMPVTLDKGSAVGQPAAHTTGIVNTVATAHGFGYYSDAIAQGGAAWDIGATENYIPYPYSPNLSSWTQYTPASCDVSTFAVASNGTGFVFGSHHDTTNGCTGLSLPLTLVVGQKYLVYWKMNLVRDYAEVGFDGSTPPNVIDSGASACPTDDNDTWHLLADNANLEVVNEFADIAHPAFDADLHRTYLLTPTATNVTLKAEVLARSIFNVCQDVAYFFKPIAVVPVLGVCSTTRYQSCDPCLLPNGGCPVGETCS